MKIAFLCLNLILKELRNETEKTESAENEEQISEDTEPAQVKNWRRA